MIVLYMSEFNYCVVHTLLHVCFIFLTYIRIVTYFHNGLYNMLYMIKLQVCCFISLYYQCYYA